jgi:uncharacterized ion transporter superfamily protein YfcC
MHITTPRRKCRAKMMMIIIIIIIIIFINCNWVVTWWQYTFTHRQYTDNTNNNRNKIATNSKITQTVIHSVIY